MTDLLSGLVASEANAGLRCTACEGTELRRQSTRTAFWDDDRLVVVEGVPALVCQRCGEQFYDDATAIGLDLLRGSGFPADRARGVIAVPVFDFSDAAALRVLP